MADLSPAMANPTASVLAPSLMAALLAWRLLKLTSSPK
jgi:hypothetical protein